MAKKILFSPIGGTDPIRYLRDGSMLHICRVYQPDIVYLYLSHEMYKIHKTDNRYVYCIEHLGELLQHAFEVHIIEREDLIDVQQYDVFYRDFREIIKDLEQKMEKDDELLINMASGTPAMKSALLVMATLAEYRFLPIQVSTPLKKMNAESEKRDDYDVEVNWELNEDNTSAFVNRCEEVKCFNLMRLLKIDIIKKHIEAYDYTAALSVANEIREEIPEDAYRLIEIAVERVKLNRNKINRLTQNKTYDIFPIKEGNKQKMFEYALVLQIKLHKEEYADFIRGITPIVVDLLEAILDKQCGIRISDYCTEKDGMKKWDSRKLENSEILTLLNEEYNGESRFGPVYSNALAKLIERKCTDATVIKKVGEITKAESMVRNVAAHEIVSVTDEWFQKKAGKSAQDIFADLRYLIGKAGINATAEQWRSYEHMNHMIKERLEENM